MFWGLGKRSVTTSFIRIKGGNAYSVLGLGKRSSTTSSVRYKGGRTTRAETSTVFVFFFFFFLGGGGVVKRAVATSAETTTVFLGVREKGAHHKFCSHQGRKRLQCFGG